MSFFELFDQFFQLNDQQPIKPLASKLYMYWLHGFNKARWPALLYRRANQVFTDLGCDKGTLATAVSQLEARGLLAYEAGKNGLAGKWYLNYEPAAVAWVSKVKNSAQPQESEVENSPSTTTSEVENSPSNSALEAFGTDSRVDFSPSIRNRQDLIEVEDQPTPSASACVGEAAEEITPAPLSAKNSKLVPPVAEPPHAGQPGPVAAAELPEALAAEAKTLASTIGQLWQISEIKNFTKWARIAAFTKRLAQLGKLEELKTQFAGYKLQREKAGIRPHSLDNWLGSYADDFQNGEWCGCDWAAVANDTRTRPGQVETQPARAATSRRQAQPQEW